MATEKGVAGSALVAVTKHDSDFSSWEVSYRLVLRFPLVGERVWDTPFVEAKHSTQDGKPTLEFITAGDLQDLLGIGKENAYRLMNEEIGFIRVGRRKLIRVSSYERWLKEKEVSPR